MCARLSFIFLETAFGNAFICFNFLSYIVDIVRMDPQAFEKNQKRHFFRDIQKSFQEVTPIGPEPHQFFSF